MSQSKVTQYDSTKSGKDQTMVMMGLKVYDTPLGRTTYYLAGNNRVLPESMHKNLRQLVEQLFSANLITIFEVEFALIGPPTIRFFTNGGSDQALLTFASQFCQFAQQISGSELPAGPVVNLSEVEPRIIEALESIL